MNVEEFSKYVIGNLHRATLSNALNIADKINGGIYDINDFIEFCTKEAFYKREKNSITEVQYCKMIVAFDRCKKSISANVKSLTAMAVDCLIIDMWKAICEV